MPVLNIEGRRNRVSGYCHTKADACDLPKPHKDSKQRRAGEPRTR